jgi:hypothetical protein
MADTFDRVPRDEKPDAQITSPVVPDEVLKRALTLDYGACPFCEHRQWYGIREGWNSTKQCERCGETVDVIG